MSCRPAVIFLARFVLPFTLILFAIVSGCGEADRSDESAPDRVTVRSVSTHSLQAPVYFERDPNDETGQGRFLGRGLQYSMSAQSDGLTIRSHRSPLAFDLRFEGANRHSIPEGVDSLDSYSSYFKGAKGDEWIRGSRHFGRVRYADLYPGIDLEVYGTEERTLEFDYIVHPGSDPGVIELRIEGADSHWLSPIGSLEIKKGDERFRLRAPILYQMFNDRRRPVEGEFILASDAAVMLEVGPYDQDHDLIIDPELAYATRLGGSGGEVANAVAIDPDGNVIVAGSTGSIDFPSVNAYGSDADGTTGDFFITKFDPSGDVLFSTYLGGSGFEHMGCDGSPPGGVALDSNGNIWFVGRTTSTDFPLEDPIQVEITPTPGRDNPKPEVVIANLTAAGDDLLFSTYYGGEGLDEGCAIDVDGQGNVYFTGMTESDEFHPAGNMQVKKGAFDGFSVKLGPDRSVVYSTYLGGNEVLFYEKGTDIVAGPNGSAFVIGYSDAPDFPPVPAEEAVIGGLTDAFLVKLDSDGSISDVAVDLGGSETDIAHGVDIDLGSGRIAVVGMTASNDFPVGGGPFPSPVDLADQFRQNGFMTLFDLSGETLWSSYVGGSGFSDAAYQVAFGSDGRAIIVGSTGSPEFPPEGAFQGPSGSVDTVPDGFVVEVDLAEPSLTFWSFIGGSSIDNAYAVDANSSGSFAVTGVTLSADYQPLDNAFQSEARANDAFVLRFGDDSQPGITVSPNPVQFPVTVPGETSTETVTITSSGTAPLEIQNIDVEPTPVFSFPDEPEFPVTLDPGETLMFEIAYSPVSPSLPSLTDSGTGSRSNDAAGAPTTQGISNHQLAISNEGTLTVVSNAPTQILAVPLRAGGIVVNDAGDEEDPTPDDGNCDVDTGMEGNQCTLRAAIQVINQEQGAGAVRVMFDIPNGDPPSALAPLIGIGEPLPEIRHASVFDASTQPGSNFVRVEPAGMGDQEMDGILIEAENVTVRGLNINRFNGWGIRVNGGGGHRIAGNFVGVRLEIGDLSINTKGGVLIENGARDVTLGGEMEEMNVIFGGVVIDGESTEGIRVMENDIWIPTDWTEFRSSDHYPRVPIDHVAGAEFGRGLGCPAWIGEDEAGSRNALARQIPAPRLLSIDEQGATGITRPNATVILFSVVTTGVAKARYLPIHVRPLGRATADDDGRFRIESALPLGTRVSALAIDENGNTSELSQLRRPLIMLPGVGGSWLVDKGGEPLWIGIPRISDRFARLGMEKDGIKSIEPVIRVDGVLERLKVKYIKKKFIYGPFLSYLEQDVSLGPLDSPGYVGDIDRPDRTDLDLYRLAYDWRLSGRYLADTLHTVVNRLTGNDPGDERAFSCEVDILTHSNGGVVASVYVKRESSHRRNRVHRLITTAAPYLGTPQPVAAHVQGYMFGVEEGIPSEFLKGGFKWPAVIEAFQNLPGGYALLPSRNYWKAAGWESGSSLTIKGYLQDLSATQLTDYEATLDFMTRPKLSSGMARNGDIWVHEEDWVHKLIDDWRDYSGPPQIFRMVGDLPDKTSVGWEASTYWFRSGCVGRYKRRLPDDTDAIANYRSCISPILGRGDGTVSLISSTLGRGLGPGRAGVDFSGVDESNWIEENELYQGETCDHNGILQAACMSRASTDNGPTHRAWDRIRYLLDSGYRVMAPTAGIITATGKSEVAGRLRELVYVHASGPIAVNVVDQKGASSGPEDIEDIGQPSSTLPGVSVWATEQTVTLSASPDTSYTIRVRPAQNDTEVRFSRVSTDPAVRTSLLFQSELVQLGGSIEFMLAAGGTSGDQPIMVDREGDGEFESIPPAALSDGDLPAVAGAVPTPGYFQVEALVSDPSDPELELVIPQVGDLSWNWEIEFDAEWIELSPQSGGTPNKIAITLDRSQLVPGLHTDTLWTTVGVQDFVATYPVVVQLGLRSDATSGPEITLVEPSTILRGSQSFDLEINGFGFSEDSQVVVVGSGVVVADVTYESSERIVATLNVGVAAELGARDVVVINPDGQIATGEGVLSVVDSEIPEVLLEWSAPGSEDLSGPSDLVARVVVGSSFSKGAQSHGTAAIESIRIYRSSISNAAQRGEIVGWREPQETTYTDRELVPGTYFYQVTAVYESGESEPSNEVEVTIGLSAVSVQTDELPTRTFLHPNYPNPFNPSTTITYDVAEVADVRIAIYDALGRRVEVIGTWRRAPGTYSVTWDATGLPSGMYFCRLETRRFVQTRKVLLVR